MTSYRYSHTDESTIPHTLQISTYQKFEAQFEYQGDRLYSHIFAKHRDNIKVSTEKFAIRNLQKIFDATFVISPRIGFQAMSLRDLSAETGLSMGGLYSSIPSKESIVMMVKDVIALVCDEVVTCARQQENPEHALQTLLRGYLYASTLLQPWFNFLYFETKSLPQQEQEASKNIELQQVEAFATILKRLKPDLENQNKAQFVATMLLSLTQERYLKPWKYPNAPDTVDAYAEECLALIYGAIDYQRS